MCFPPGMDQWTREGKLTSLGHVLDRHMLATSLTLHNRWLWEIRLSSFYGWTSCLPKVIGPVSGQVGQEPWSACYNSCCSSYQATC